MPPGCVAAQAHARDVDLVLAQKRSKVSYNAWPVFVPQQQYTPEGTISVGWLYEQSAGSRANQNVPPADTTFSPFRNACTCNHSLNVTGSAERFSSTVKPSVDAMLRTFTLFRSFTEARDRKPSSTARVTGSMFRNSCALPP